MNILLLSILIILEVAILAIGSLLAPEDGGLVYWGTIIWIGLLVGLNWFASASIFSKSATTDSNEAEETGSVMGILPGLNILIFGYSIFSVALLLSTTGFGLLSWTWQLVIQIVAFTSMTVLCLVMFIASKGATFGANSAVTKSQILEQLRRIKRVSQSDEITGLVDSAIPYVASQMPHPARLDQESLSSAYENLKHCDPEDIHEVTRVMALVSKL